MSGDAPNPQTEPHTSIDTSALVHPHGREGNVVGVLQHGDGTAPIEADVELARQPVERAVVEDVVVPGLGIGTGVDQLLRVYAGCGRAGDVADVVGARPFGGDAEARQPLDQGNGSVRQYISYLQIRARRHVRVAPAVRLRQVGDAGQLPVRENAVGDAQPAHVGVLCRRQVEQPVEAPAEIVDALGEQPLRALVPEAAVGIEGMLVALGLLLGRELPACRLEAGHGGQVLLVGPGRLGRAATFGAKRLQALCGAACLDARHEAFQIAALLFGEVLRAHQAASA